MNTWEVIGRFGDVEFKADRIAYDANASLVLFLNNTSDSEVLVGVAPTDCIVTKKGD